MSILLMEYFGLFLVVSLDVVDGGFVVKRTCFVEVFYLEQRIVYCNFESGLVRHSYTVLIISTGTNQFSESLISYYASYLIL